MTTRSTGDKPNLRFDFRPLGEPARHCCFRSPQEIITAESLADVAPAIARIDRVTSQGRYAAGYIAYEAAPAFDRALTARPHHSAPLVWFGIFDAPARCTHTGPLGTYTLSGWRTRVGPTEHAEAVAAIREAIADGDVYQANFTFRLHADFSGDDGALYADLLGAQQHAYGAYLRLGEQRVLSVSPELFLERRGELLLSRPMKGTARRRTRDDARARDRLRASEKDRAENVMIVDLVRNDLGRIARTGTVSVPRLYDIEPYCGVHQMTSTVTAACSSETRLGEILAALFPAGSITGAPKVAASRLIASLEESPRGAYCGAIGYIEPGGDFRFSVGIRTATLDVARGQLTYGVGGAITWDSNAEAEYDEALAKAHVVHACPAQDNIAPHVAC